MAENNELLLNRTKNSLLKGIWKLKKVFSIVLTMLVLLACSSEDSSNEDKTDNQVNYDGTTYELSAGLEEVFQPDDNHSSSQINITNGEFYTTQVVLFGNLTWIWRAREASVWLYVNMYSPGTTEFSEGTFSFAPRETDEDDPALANTYFFKKGKFAIDLNNDGQIESDDNEFLEVIGGTMTLTQNGAVYTVTFNWTLENGVNATGSFTGDFNQV